MIKISKLTVHYQNVLALENVDTEIHQGEMIAIVGANGAGKSTLLKAIMAQVKAAAGGVEFKKFGLKNIAYLPQSQKVDRSFPITVKEFVSAGTWRKTGLWRAFTPFLNKQMLACLRQVGLENSEHKQIGELSGGQFQRMLFARMLIQDAQILILDEPFNSVDMHTTRDLAAVIQGCHAAGKTVIAVIHDMPLVKQYFPETALLAGRLIAKGPTEQVLTQDNMCKAGFHPATVNEL
ncbi:metal ABC transporter ATP-binding protein [Psychromonas ossibalaenae]|uniref:metal ABC transporter ATP-binding protein n=1 Tax=Psychromonas ossibalaenae TaxID=444922 RepID=UPI000477E1B3|nr:metal ABC transporter ATP-binding protein [Psychromonas ossibalaenae]